MGVKKLRIDPSCHDAQIVKAQALKLRFQGIRGHHGAGCAVMKFAQIRHDGFAQPTDPIVLAVTGEVGSEIRRHWQP